MELFSSLSLGSRTARNRIVFGPHETNLGSGRVFSSRHLAYYRRRARGGVGIVVLEEASVHNSDWPYERCPLASVSGSGWEAIAKALHDEGALVLAALGHSGGEGSSAYSQRPLWAPSNVPNVVSKEIPKAMELEDIAAVVAGFGEATRLAIAAGLDGVEINAGQYSLIRQFLSGLTNHRDDGYGQDRLRFAREVLEVVRSAANGAIVGLRLSCDELVPWGGIDPEAGVAIAMVLAKQVDYVTVVRGSMYSTAATRPDMHEAPGFNLHLARMVRAVVPEQVAVILQGSIIAVEMAQQALGDGVCNAVEMTRAQIADPDLAAKAEAGHLDRIRPCVLCNQSCQVRDVRNPIVSCIGEPSAGHEWEDPPVEGRATRPTDVTVVGGGPAGLECARVAALRGHRVRLLEQSEQLGGAVRIAATGAGRARLSTLVDWLEAECRNLGVQIETGRTVTAADLTRVVGSVVLCTGGRPGEPDFVVDEGAIVLSAEEVLRSVSRGETDQVLPRGPVAIWDPIGGPVAVSVAELLAKERVVTLITSDLLVGRELSRTGDLVAANIRLHTIGARLVKRSLLRRVQKGVVIVEDRFSGAVQQIEAVALLNCGHRLAEDALWRSTQQAFARAGDVVAPRSIYEAILEGRRCALSI